MSGPLSSQVSAASLESIAADAVERARAAGAEQAEVLIESARTFSVRVLGSTIDSLKQSVSRGLGLRVMVEERVGFVSSTDLRSETLDDLSRRAVALARFSARDPANAIPAPDPGDTPVGDLRLFDAALAELPPEAAIDMAMTLERAALGYDRRIRRTQGSVVAVGDGTTVIANSKGLMRHWRGTSIHASVAPLADDHGGKQQSGYHSVAKRWRGELPPLEDVAIEAARRAVARIGARSVPAARVPLVMHPDVGAAWLSEMHHAFGGDAVIKKSSWLTDRLGQSIAAPMVTIVDHGRLTGGVGSAPYDGEGIPTQRNVLVQQGVCAMFEYDTYHARRAGARPTGSAARSYSSLPAIGYHNLYMEAGSETPEAILARVDRGFYMDDQGSFGFNPVTGDYSFQAQGFWIEKGEKAFPVDGVTVASNSLAMLRNVAAVGNDLKFEQSVVCPTLLIAEMTVSGAG